MEGVSVGEREGISVGEREGGFGRGTGGSFNWLIGRRGLKRGMIKQEFRTLQNEINIQSTGQIAALTTNGDVPVSLYFVRRNGHLRVESGNLNMPGKVHRSAHLLQIYREFGRVYGSCGCYSFPNGP